VIPYLAAILYGFGSALVFRWLGNWPAIRATGNRMAACVLEFALYSEQPVLVWRAQKRLIGQNLRLLVLLLIPSLLPLGAFACLYGPMDGWFGHQRLSPGDVAVAVSLRSSGGNIAVPAGLVVETPALKIARTGATVWRVRAEAPVDAVALVDGQSAMVDSPATPWVGRFLAVSALAGVLAARFVIK
jgi:hypothetical protein